MRKRWIYFWLVGLIVTGLVACEDLNVKDDMEMGSETESSFFKNSGDSDPADAGMGVFSMYSDQAGYMNATDCPNYAVYSYPLWAGKDNNAGMVYIGNDDEYLYVHYNTNGSADLLEAHVYVWTDMMDIPDRRPAPGKAPYKAEDIMADEYMFMIPLSDFSFTELCGATFYVSTHAALVGDMTMGDDDDDGVSENNAGETAYAGDSDGFEKRKGAWWGYVTYEVECFYDISGYVYNDADSSYTYEMSEDVFEGIQVVLYDGMGDPYMESYSNANGMYFFENVPGEMDYMIDPMNDPVDYMATENEDGFYIYNLSMCYNDINFGYFMPDDEGNEGGGEGGGEGNGNDTGALSYISFETFCSDTIEYYTSSGAFDYDVETDYQQMLGNIKYQAVGDQLGEDGVMESDTYTFYIACDVDEIKVTTKNADTNSLMFAPGDEFDMGNGFTVKWVSKMDYGGSFEYVFMVTSDGEAP